MERSLLQTKLYIPRLRPDQVPRTILVERLDEGIEQHRVLTLISAPAGYGKTSLVVEWTHKRQGPTAWFSIDRFDNEPDRFFPHLIAAVEQAVPALGKQLNRHHQANQLPPPLAMISRFINDFGSVFSEESTDPTHPLLLVLDDYQYIDAPAIHESIDYLLENMPPGLQLVIVTRQDPPLSLSRLRALDMLNEIRQADLRFSLDESTAFLRRFTGAELTRDEIGSLTERTEGWAAGLQLAGLSMRGMDRTTQEKFLAGFSGRHHFVLDYLTDEVLKRQSQQIRLFLSCTSILERMCSDLCDAVIESAAVKKDDLSGRGSQSILDHLEDSNLFVFPLDNERRWYRYHVLFAELLQARLAETDPEILPTLNHAAALWYEENGFMTQAVKHEFLAGDMDLTADMISRAMNKFDTWSKVEIKTFLGWLQSLPINVLNARPWLRLFMARSLFVTGKVKEAVRILESLEDWLKNNHNFGDRNRLLGTVQADRASYAVVEGDAGIGITYARNSIEKLDRSDTFGQMRAQAILGLAYSRLGDVNAAEAAFASAIDIAHDADLSFGITPLIANLADIQITQGRLHEALASCDSAISLGTVDGKRTASSGFASLEKGKILYEWNRLGEAEQYLREALAFLRQGGITQSFGNVHSMLGLVLQAQGLEDDALILAMEGVSSAESDGIDRLIILAKAYEARIWLAQGAAGRAARWAAEYIQVKNTEYIKEFEDLTLAQVHLALNEPEKALELLGTLKGTAESHGRIGSLIQIDVMRSLAMAALGRSKEGLSVLENTLNAAYLQGYRRVFLDQGLPLARLIYELRNSDSVADYVTTLLNDFDQEPMTATKVEQRGEISPQKPYVLIEPLSSRELEVLTLLALGLSNREIAERLFLSPHTVRSHTYNLYGKLGVHSRTQAAAKARELGLIS